MSDLGPLLAAVTDEWERGKTIAERAGIDGRTAGQRLGALERDGCVVSTRNPAPRNVGDRVLVYRRGPKAPPLIVPPTAEQRYLQALIDIAGWEHWQSPTWREIAIAALEDSAAEIGR